MNFTQDFEDNLKHRYLYGPYFNQNIPKVIRALSLITLCLMCVLLIQLVGAVSASASPDNWISGDITVRERPDLSTNPDDYGTTGQCTYQYVQLPNDWGYYKDTQACIFQAKSFKYTITTDGRLFISKSGDLLMYPVVNVGIASSRYIIPSPLTDDVIINTNIIKDLFSKVTYNFHLTNPYYDIQDNFLTTLSKDDTSSDHDTYGTAISRNGKWMVINFREIGFVRINLINMQTTWIAANRGKQEWMAVSNDGQHLAVTSFSSYNLPVIYNMNNCGQSAENLKSQWFSSTLSDQCNSNNLGDEINKSLGSDWFTSNAKPEFSEDDAQLTLFVRPYNKGGEGISLTVPPSISKLDYLALGDSYSSGEGDTGKQANGSSFYLPSTDYKDGCHLSSRSYPFLIQSYLRIANERMKSIACSGARVKQDYTGDSSAYSGQGNRIINETIERQRAMKADALSNFTPGIVKQIDFVRDNKPAFVTLTGGGNDVGFAKILTYCALPSGVGEASNTCDEALTGKKQNSMLGDAITGQYDQTLKLIAALKAASNNTKIYIIGYPSFVSDEKNTCLNGAMLNKKERTMINMGVSYLNNILSHAAKVGGAYYIDIEKSLYGGRICEGSSLITGPLAVVGFDMNNHKNEMFHPNYLAHEAIAKTIFAAGISAEGVNPTPDPNATSPTKPDFFGNATYVRTTQEKLVSDGAIYAGKSILFSTSPGIFTANEIINFTIWSDEAKLGSLNTDAEGRIDGSLKLPPSIKPGYHMVMAEGRSPSGELTRVYQFVEVQGSSNDEDGDGITNDKDQCEFMAVWYDEQTGRDICNTSIQPGRPKASSTNSSSTNPSLASIGAANTGVIQPTQTGAVLGAHDNANIKQNNLHDVSSHNDMPARLMAGIGAVFTLLVILLVTNFVRRQTK